MLKNKALGTLTKKQEEAIETIKNESDRLAKLINDILDLSRLESGKVKLNVEKTVLSRITDDRIYYKLAEKKGISIVNNVL